MISIRLVQRWDQTSKQCDVRKSFAQTGMSFSQKNLDPRTVPNLLVRLFPHPLRAVSGRDKNVTRMHSFLESLFG